MLSYRCDFCSLTTKSRACILDGLYCPTLPNHHHKLLGASHSPMDMIKQGIREQCVFDSILDKSKSHWFAYMQMAIDTCINSEGDGELGSPISENCNDQVIEIVTKDAEDEMKIDINKTKYKACVKKQYSLLQVDAKDRSESYLERDLIAEKSVGAVFHPSISVNNHTFRGEYHDTNDLFKGICSTMTSRPVVCSKTNLIGHKDSTIDGP